jgi:hypothetical protein
MSESSDSDLDAVAGSIHDDLCDWEEIAEGSDIQPQGPFYYNEMQRPKHIPSTTMTPVQYYAFFVTSIINSIVKQIISKYFPPDPAQYFLSLPGTKMEGYYNPRIEKKVSHNMCKM